MIYAVIRCLPLSLYVYVQRDAFYFRLNDFTYVKLISSELVRLNSIFASRFSKCKPSHLWNNIISMVLVSTKCNTSNINVDDLIYGPTDTPFHLPPFLLKPLLAPTIVPLLYRIKSNSTENSLGIPP